MFEGRDHPKSLAEETLNLWLENGRSSKLGYHYLLVIWDEYEMDYRPAYVSQRDEIDSYQGTNSRERLIAVYDLYSESKIL